MEKKLKMRFLRDRTLKKTLKVMKLTCFLLLLGSLHMYVSASAQKGTVSLNVKNVSVQEVFDLIESKSDYTFMYNNELLAGLEKVSITGEKPIVEVLKQCLQDSGLSWKMVEDVIVLHKSEKLNQEPEVIKIEGLVTDRNGESIPGFPYVSRERHWELPLTIMVSFNYLFRSQNKQPWYFHL